METETNVYKNLKDKDRSLNWQGSDKGFLKLDDKETRAPITCSYKKPMAFVHATIDICSLWALYRNCMKVLFAVAFGTKVSCVLNNNTKFVI